MRHWINRLFKKTSTKEVFFTSVSITLFITIIRSIGLLQPLEFTAYDLLFFLRPNEPIEDRIVIVAWDEPDIQMSQEGTMSDNTLVKVLSRIIKQEPSFIGLDIVRDVPVTSPLLSDAQNEEAYEKLVEIFRSTPKLIGIEKVLPPFFKPPFALAEKEQIAAADLIVDRDNTVRRAYIFPLEDEKGNPAEPAALGAYLGSNYLLNKGWVASIDKKKNNALQMTSSKTDSKIILEPLGSTSGSYLIPEEGMKILVNWRKGNIRFSTVFVSEVAAGNIPPDIFKDKIVLIGNVSASGADKHYLPINRWVDNEGTNGVEIHAQIASSIISAAIDGRPLIKTIPESVEYLILISTIIGISLIAEKYRSNRPLTMGSIATGGAVAISSSLMAVSVLAFSQGYFIPIVPSILGAFFTVIVICVIIYISKIKQTNQDFKELIKDLNHSYQNYLRSIKDNGKTAHEIAEVFYKQEDKDEVCKLLEEHYGESPYDTLYTHLNDLVIQTEELSQQREKTQEYFSNAYLGKEVFRPKPTNFNQFINITVRKKIIAQQSKYQLKIKISENYDPHIEKVTIDPIGFTSVIDNLIDNACYAIAKQKKKLPEHIGVISIQTRKINKSKIQLSIQDNGIGINSENIGEIFRPFKSFKPRNEGQGLGLSIVSSAIERHNGKIRVETKKGEGSKFMIILNN